MTRLVKQCVANMIEYLPIHRETHSIIAGGRVCDLLSRIHSTLDQFVLNNFVYIV